MVPPSTSNDSSKIKKKGNCKAKIVILKNEEEDQFEKNKHNTEHGKKEEDM